ncbi:MAG: prepilin-type N-terminal cleavage/methylation domain-containing protein, partial [bacterium]|nr:prepilin-type N-terminal cleavage/methylation domain-containing protein [bacterium]
MKVWRQVGQFHKRRKDALTADQKGFTLLEVLIAMIILAVIAIPICRVYVSAAQTNAKARKQASATAVAENTMEGINAFSYEDVIRQFDPSVTP